MRKDNTSWYSSVEGLKSRKAPPLGEELMQFRAAGSDESVVSLDELSGRLPNPKWLVLNTCKQH